MSRYLYMIGAVLLLLGTVIGIARADFPYQGGWHLHGVPGRFPLAYFGRQLDLTDTQKKQIKSIWTAESPTVVPLLRQLLTESNGAAHSSGGFDESYARAVADKQAASISQLLVERQRMISKIYNDVFTPEQRKKADQLCERMHARVEGFLDQMDRSTD